MLCLKMYQHLPVLFLDQPKISVGMENDTNTKNGF